MRIFQGFDNLPAFRNAVATMGSFDGVHGGHRELLRRVESLASAAGGESIVFTFEPHPRYVLGTGGDMRLLSTIGEKLWLLERMGVGNVIIIPFTEQFSRTSPREFIEKIVARTGIRSMVVGYNHRFGRDKEGDYGFLESHGCGLEIHMVEQQHMADSKVSSTVIRRTIACGMMDKARMLLSHPYIIICEVSADGYLTGIDPHKLLPAAGSYEARVNGRPATLHVGDGTLRVDPAGTEGKVIIEL